MRTVSSWRCPRGHVLGMVVESGRGVRNLLLYREAIDPLGEAADVDVIATVQGDMMDARCSVCGAVRTWSPDARSIRRAMKTYEDTTAVHRPRGGNHETSH